MVKQAVPAWEGATDGYSQADEVSPDSQSWIAAMMPTRGFDSRSVHRTTKN